MDLYKRKDMQMEIPKQLRIVKRYKHLDDDAIVANFGETFVVEGVNKI